MNKYIVAFDVETTGLGSLDQIIQLAMIKISKETMEQVDSKMWYIEPAHAYEISPAAALLHGITKEFLKEHGVYIKDISQEIIDFVQDSDYLTYNGNTFDVKFIYRDLMNVGVEFPLEDKVFYDAFALYKRYHPSTLAAVYKQYTGEELDDAHDALADVKATIEVFKHIQQEQDMSLQDLGELAECQLLSPEGSIRRANNMNDDHIVFSVGKYRDCEICEVLKKDPSYVKWFGDTVLSNYTKRLLNKYVAAKRQAKQ